MNSKGKSTTALDLDSLPKEAFTKNLLRFARINGPNIVNRTQKFYDWWNGTRVETGLGHYFKSLDAKPLPDSSVKNFYGEEVSGINFGNQDYLGLASHEAIKEAAIHAVEKYGPHSAGSGPLQGNTEATLQLEEKLYSRIYKAP